MYETCPAALELIARRKSVRDFLPRDVEPEKRQAIYDAILAAPTTENMMMYTVISVTDPEIREKLSKQPAIRRAPMVLAFCASWFFDVNVLWIILACGLYGFGRTWAAQRKGKGDAA